MDEYIVPEEAVESAAIALSKLSGKRYSEHLAEARAALEAAWQEMLPGAWDDGVVYGHTVKGNLIDKRMANPYPRMVNP